MDTKQNHDFIDLFKFIASIFIFTMHINAFSSINETVQFYGIQLLSRWGVPFFFTISAFFLFKQSESNHNVTRNQLIGYVKRIAFLYIAWFILNIPYIIYNLYTRGLNNPMTWFKFFRDLLISSTFMGSWYMASSIFCAWLIHVLANKFSNLFILIVTFMLYVVCIVTGPYSTTLLPASLNRFISNYIGSPQNTIIAGCFFFALGKFIANNYDKISKTFSKTSCLLGVILSYSAFFIEMHLLKSFNLFHSSDTSLFLIPLAFFLVVLNTKLNHKITCAKLLRKLSTIIYCSQATVILAANFICKLILNIQHSFIVFIVGSFLIAILSIIILAIDKSKRLPLIKYLT